MKTLWTVVLALIAIGASLVFILSTICTFNGGVFSGQKDPAYLICAIVALAVVVATIWAIAKLNKRL